jgi:uncharacterized membrane protein YkvA (DUF1232 family)
MLESLKAWAKRLKRDVVTLMFASRDSATHISPKLLALATVAYALSPVDLIPDFIPVVGYLDDLIIVPLGIWLCLRLIPPPVIANKRASAEVCLAGNRAKPRNMIGLTIILVIFLVSLRLAAMALVRKVSDLTLG